MIFNHLSRLKRNKSQFTTHKLSYYHKSSYVYSNSFFPRKCCRLLRLMLLPKDLRKQIIRKKARPRDDWA